MGLEPYPPIERHPGEKTAPASIDLSGKVELVVLSVAKKAARCRILGSNSTITLRAGRLWEAVPGEIATVRPRKQWNYARGTYLSGVIESTRIDATALGLVPLKLEDRRLWNPNEPLGEEESRSRSGPSRYWPGARSSRWSSVAGSGPSRSVF
jgi:hypothetical protein